MVIITFRAAAARFARADQHQKISALLPRESANLGGARYALMEGNTIRDTGDLDRLIDWLRGASVLTALETVEA